MQLRDLIESLTPAQLWEFLKLVEGVSLPVTLPQAPQMPQHGDPPAVLT